MSAGKAPRISLLQSWTSHVRSAMLHVISLAQFATVYTRSWAVDSLNERVRLKVENNRLRQELALLQEEIRIKDARMTQISPQRRPHYPPTQRMAILELRAARSWSLQQTADAFLLTAATIASWMKRVDEQGPDALVQLHQPVNRFPDFVRYAVARLKTLCPGMGKVKIAQTLCRAGLHLGTRTPRLSNRNKNSRNKKRKLSAPLLGTSWGSASRADHGVMPWAAWAPRRHACSLVGLRD